MNKLIHSLLAASMAAGAAAALANTDNAPAQRVEITAPRASAQAEETAQVVRNLHNLGASYEMSSGRTMQVTTYGEALRVRYGRRAMGMLRHDGQGSFVSSDGRLAMQFDIDTRGDAQQVRLTMPVDWQ